MLRVFNDAAQQRLGEMIVHASKLGVLDQLVEQLHYLSTYGDSGDHGTYSVCMLGYDCAPYSLGFTRFHLEFDGDGTEELKPWFSGAFIFHPGTSGPDQSLSVDLSTNDNPHWSVHT